MRRSVWLATLGAALLTSAGIHGAARAQTAGNTVNYPAGTVLVSGPPGSDFPVADGPLSTLQTSDRSYERAAVFRNGGRLWLLGTIRCPRGSASWTGKRPAVHDVQCCRDNGS